MKLIEEVISLKEHSAKASKDSKERKQEGEESELTSRFVGEISDYLGHT